MSRSSVKVVEAESSQQSNGYDCGCFLLKNAQNVTEHFEATKSLQSTPKLRESDMVGFRRTMHDLILSLWHFRDNVGGRGRGFYNRRGCGSDMPGGGRDLLRAGALHEMHSQLPFLQLQCKGRFGLIWKLQPEKPRRSPWTNWISFF